MPGVVDLHNHLLAGVDDGAADPDGSRAALRAMAAEGVEALVVTPHLAGSLTARPERWAAAVERVDAAWAEFAAMAAAEFPAMRVERGAEVMLDVPAPDLAHPALRLAGSPFVLVEFPGMRVPPRSADALRNLRAAGWIPVVAHPERYVDLDAELRAPGAWRDAGAYLQINCGSLTGRYGARARDVGWDLLRRGWGSFLASDYHARGNPGVVAALAALEEAGGAEQAHLLARANPAALLGGRHPEPVEPLERELPFWRRIAGLWG